MERGRRSVLCWPLRIESISLMAEEWRRDSQVTAAAECTRGTPALTHSGAWEVETAGWRVWRKRRSGKLSARGLFQRNIDSELQALLYSNPIQSLLEKKKWVPRRRNTVPKFTKQACKKTACSNQYGNYSCGKHLLGVSSVHLNLLFSPLCSIYSAANVYRPLHVVFFIHFKGNKI